MEKQTPKPILDPNFFTEPNPKSTGQPDYTPIFNSKIARNRRKKVCQVRMIKDRETPKMVLEGIDLTGFIFSKCIFRGAKFLGCFGRTSFQNCNLYQANFEDCDFQNIDFHQCHLREAIIGGKFCGSDWSGVNLEESLLGGLFTGIRLNQCSFRDANLHAVTFKDCEFHAVDFTRTSLELDPEGWLGCTLPSGVTVV